MSGPTVLVVDGHDVRRKDVVRALAGFAYEVITATDADEGIRFATGLAPNVIIADASLDGFSDGSVLAEFGDGEDAAVPRLVLLADDGEPPEALPEEVLHVVVGGLTTAAIVRKLRTLLVALEVGLHTDGRLESLIGDLHASPLFELLQALQRAVVTGRVLIGDGEVVLHEGEVIAARCARARGAKALARLSRTASGDFRVLLGPVGGERELDRDLLTLMAESLEDQAAFAEACAELPDLASRARVEMGPAFFATNFTATQQKLLESMHGALTVWALLDAVAASDGAVLTDLIRLHRLGFVVFEEPDAKVRVVTDSTSDLPPDLALRHGIHVVPLSVIFGREIFKDGIDLTPGAFYRMLQERKDTHPHTNPPTRGEFATAFRPILAKYDIVSVHISEKMSQTVVNARAAADAGGAGNGPRPDGSPPAAEIVDASQVSIGLGLLTLFGARMARRGLDAAAIRAHLEAMRERFHLLFVVDTLEYLARGGRIGKARALLGGMLGIKPILGVIDGEVAPVDRVRGGRAAHPKLVELYKRRVDAEKPVVVGLAHANAPVWAERLRALLEQSFTIAEMVTSEIGPVVGTHAGPGTVGAVLFQPTEEEMPLIAPLPVAE